MIRDEKLPRFVVLVDTSTGWGRRLIHGVQLYAQKEGPWHLWIEARGQHEHLRPPPGWKGEGIIARISTPAMARELARMKVPVVNISGISLSGVKRFPTVSTDLHAAGKLAAEHFLDRGFEHFAYFGLLRLAFVAEHHRAFADSLSEVGKTCHVYKPPAGRADWKRRQASLADWLKKLPKPVGILTWARGGLAVLDACRWSGLNVPEDVAVLDGDEDELLNTAANPPMSGIEVPSELIGHEAAAMLDAMMSGEKISGDRRVMLPPSHIVVRQSTDTLAIQDKDLADALRYIRQHVADPIGVEDVLREVPVSRRSLERKFEQTLGRSPATEIRRVHLERAKQLLVETDMPIPAVAQASGYGSPEYLSYAFKSAVGMTPLRYRSHLRAR
jgi:LacI family transcriptional regulator